MCFSQNIDTLERMAGVPEHKIVEAHGSFAAQHCVDCQTPYDDEKMKEKVKAGEVPRCEDCDGLVKPDIVFFGESVRFGFFLRLAHRRSRCITSCPPSSDVLSARLRRRIC
jgi:NAD-dependent histone deacetylase SIR2